MLGLAEQVSGDKAGLRRLIRKNGDLAGSGDGIDPHKSIDCLFGKGDKDIARSYDLIHLRDGLGAVGKGSDRLRAAHLEDPVNAGLPGCNQGVRVHRSPAARGGHDDLLHPCHLRRNHVHQHGGRVYRLSARDIYTDPG